MNRPVPSPLRAVFLSAEGVLYALFLALDLTGRGGQSVPIKYAGIVLCLAYSLLGTDRLVPLALALTAGADWFLLVRNDQYLLGIALFLAVQTVYFLRLRRAGADGAYFLRSVLALGAELGVYALGMASGVGAGILMSSAVASLSEVLPAYAEEIAALASASETISGIDGIYIAIFIGIPLCNWLYRKLEPTLGRVTKAGRRAAEELERQAAQERSR